MSEHKTVHDLVVLLRQVNVEDSDIVQTLVSIIQSQMMYGGTLQEKIEFWIDKVIREDRLNSSNH
jgi:hypothetical protein